jgi:hypothetical protein
MYVRVKSHDNLLICNLLCFYVLNQDKCNLKQKEKYIVLRHVNLLD